MVHMVWVSWHCSACHIIAAMLHGVGAVSYTQLRPPTIFSVVLVLSLIHI